jgi:tRNA(adenine34) deaminase
VTSKGRQPNRSLITRRDEDFMRHAIRLAKIARERGDSPVGSIIVYEGRVVGEGVEAVQNGRDPAAHAEIIALREACRSLGTLNLEGCTLFTTVEPCFMCSYALRVTHISRVVTGKDAPHIGGITSRHPILIDPDIPNWPPPPEVVRHVLEAECQVLFIRKAT